MLDPQFRVVSFSFPRQRRLLNAGEFRHVFDQACYKAYCPGLLLLAAPSQTEEARVGFVIGKKHVRLAVNRNRIKRVVRDSFRHHQHDLPPLDIIVLAVKGAANIDTQQLHGQLDKAWRQLCRKAQTKSHQDGQAPRTRNRADKHQA